MSSSNSSGEAHPDVGQRCMPVTAISQVDKLKETKKANKQFSLSEIEIRKFKQVNICFWVGLWQQGAKPLTE